MKKLLYIIMRWVKTFLAVAGIILLQTLIIILSMLVKSSIFSEFDWKLFILCIILTAAVVFCSYRLMKASFYVRPFGNTIFCLYPFASCLLLPSFIEDLIWIFSPERIHKCYDLPGDITSSVLVIIEIVVIPILLCILTFIKKNSAIKKDALRIEESNQIDRDTHRSVH